VTNEEIRTMWSDRFGRTDPKIVCVGLNYADHTAETNFERPKAPLLFGKFSNTLIGDGEPLVLPAGIGHVDAEAELAVVIGERVKGVSEASALDVVAAYTCANDVSARDVQFGDGQWFRGKALDGFCPIGPTLVDASGFDPADVRVRQILNGTDLQDSGTSRLIFSIPVLIAYISKAITLEPGDLILTGTPEGVGVFRDPKIPLRDGDVVEVEIEGIGVLRNEVRIEA
jgi:2-keto-4-pentenoate hydratase/2-oxohepta-3-ene-1,7-dioic acid hydratase in catechol pathway